ncbi:hypothetical protein FOL47_007105 [Perkinsus chesapeaki]|uniref:Uncharacterized protein n=1 Tax=Perkinsus chesapeaki TaxID=330153 RepID=A0A7J6MWQ6_PERCH|nr:hypothetical protein FOL47_007105 [Perkinsus chesapeaki]
MVACLERSHMMLDVHAIRLQCANVSCVKLCVSAEAGYGGLYRVAGKSDTPLSSTRLNPIVHSPAAANNVNSQVRAWEWNHLPPFYSPFHCGGCGDRKQSVYEGQRRESGVRVKLVFTQRLDEEREFVTSK